MMDSWKSLEGVTLADNFQLQKLLSENVNLACFLTRVADESPRWAWIWLALDAEPKTYDFSHPNLLQVWQTGRAERGDTSMAYILTEPADENLEGVLRDRPLNLVEAREALLNVAKALSFLHSRGLVHGQVEPVNILAVGDRIKLSSHTVQRSDETAGDMRALGECVHAMFTQTREVDLERLSAVPQPFRDIVRGCYAENPYDRWSAQRIVDTLDPPPVTVMPVVEPEAPVTATSEPAATVRINRKRIPRWVFAPVWIGIALVAILIARKPHAASSSPPPPQDTASRVVSAPAPAPRPSPVGPPVAAPAPTPAPTTASKPAPGRQLSDSRVWRVVSYTYSRAEDCARMVAEINRKFPRLEAEPFVPNESGPPFYVALGGRMTRSEATRMRERALAAGLPGDTFVRNFKK